MGAEPSQTQTPAFWGRVGMFPLSWIWGHREGRCRHHSGKLQWRAWMLLPSLVLQNFFKVIVMMCVYACRVCEYMSRVHLCSLEDKCAKLELVFLLCMGSGNELRPSDIWSKCLDLLNHLQLSSWSSWSKPWGCGRTHGFYTGGFLRHETSLYFTRVNLFYLNEYSFIGDCFSLW